MFPPDLLWKWKMNTARPWQQPRRAVRLEPRAGITDNGDDALSVIAWALGRIGGRKARQALDRFHGAAEGMVRQEIEHALDMCSGRK